MRLPLVFCLSLSTLSAMADDDAFIEGFPDVPLLPGLVENVEDRTVFDTPVGTVAETVLIASRPAREVIGDYSKDLPELGWACAPVGHDLRCQREKDALTLTDTNPGAREGRILIRLEPLA